jgi:hypothetical protein
VINELRQLETRPVAKTIFLTDHTYLYKTGFWQNFTMTFLETSHMKNVANELSFPLVTPTTHFDKRFGRYGILKSCFSSRQIGLSVAAKFYPWTEQSQTDLQFPALD